MEKRGSISTREAILRAADRVVVDWGVSGMTLEAVAREAGVSKGGLLYHFRSKEALIGGMIGRLIEGFEAVLGRELRGRLVLSTLDLATVLLEEAKVAIVPGEAFGAPGYARLSYALADEALEEGVNRLAKLLAG